MAEWNFAHVQDDVNPHILCMLERFGLARPFFIFT